MDHRQNDTCRPTAPAHRRDEAFLTSLALVARRRTNCLARYQYARQFAPGGAVCDAACGVGYGSFYLAEVADHVIGMDLSEQELGWANQYFHRPNVRFLRADVCCAWPVEERFDLITSFETLEHLAQPERFLAHVHEHLQPGGRLVLSVPNGPLDRQHHRDNHRHLQHFSPEEVSSLIGRHFPTVQCFSQVYRKNGRHYWAKILRGGRTTRLLANYSFVPGFLPEVQTWLVVARR